MNRSSSSLSAALLHGVLFLMATHLHAQVFTVDIPPAEPSVIDSDTSQLADTLGDAAGNTLYVVRHSRTLDLGAGQTETVSAGEQWILVSGKGQVVATRDFGDGSGFPIRVAFFSSRRILAQVDSGNGFFLEGFRPVNGRLESDGLLVALDGVNGGVTRTSTQKPPQKFFDVDVTIDGKLARILRFDSTKLRSGAN